ERGEPEGGRAAARLALVEARERKTCGNGARDGSIEMDGRHHLPRAAACVPEKAGDDSAAADGVFVRRRERQAEPRLAGGDDGSAVGRQADDVELQDAAADGHDLV